MTTDLDRLIEVVEVGTAEPKLFYAALTIRAILAEIAYYGSLDEAVALLEALLPGWNWGRMNDRMFVEHGDSVFSARGSNPARALLLATLQAYRNKMESN